MEKQGISEVKVYFSPKMFWIQNTEYSLLGKGYAS